MNRRCFISKLSLTTAATVAGVHGLNAQPLRLTPQMLKQPARDLLPEAVAPLELEKLALVAMEAAKATGAEYADIRIAEKHVLALKLWADPFAPVSELQSGLSYGIRVVVNGFAAFTHGSNPTADSVAGKTRDAVEAARGHVSEALQSTPFAYERIPVAKGEWSTPIEVDPFGISLEEQVALLNAYQSAATRVRYGQPGLRGTIFQWTREKRVFASSAGSLTTQNLWRSDPTIWGSGDYGMGAIGLVPRRISAASGGYETVLIPGLQDDIKNITEEAVRLASMPWRTLDVGRYPVVLDGGTMGNVVTSTLGQALELDRVLGYEADASGTSFLSPPLQMLGQQIASKALNVVAGRTLPSRLAVKWDDDGVEPREYDVIKNGQLVDYHTSAATAGALDEWYRRTGRSNDSRGCAVAPNADHQVLVRTPHLTVLPGDRAMPLDDLCKEANRGILVQNAYRVRTDQQLASGGLFYTQMFEIRDGKVVGQVRGNGIQFSTGKFFKSLKSLGGAETVRSSVAILPKGQPWRHLTQDATAPAALFGEADVIRSHIILS
jgi:TldD protein